MCVGLICASNLDSPLEIESTFGLSVTSLHGPSVHECYFCRNCAVALHMLLAVTPLKVTQNATRSLHFQGPQTKLLDTVSILGFLAGV